ncbi:MAG: 2-oxoacid:acceptor oxidoreductase family protein [Clostridiales bacterium]|nr:2-oxoacid:acceptor oxidoreductase family protein [Clostridiales bacterium]
MKENGLIEFRWHGRGGQGAKTACLLLADAAFSAGKFVQGFPEYGPERMGAPITAYNRISDVRCSIHCNIDHPDYVVVVDETLLDTVDVTHGLSPAGAVIVNTARAPQQIREKLRGWTGRVCTIDARRISEETLGRNFPNTPMLSAAVKVSGVLEEAQFKQDMEESFHHKFAAKPQVVAGNMAALVQAWEEVQAG